MTMCNYKNVDHVQENEREDYKLINQPLRIQKAVNFYKPLRNLLPWKLPNLNTANQQFENREVPKKRAGVRRLARGRNGRGE